MKVNHRLSVALGYTIPTFVLVAPSFVLNQLHLTQWEAFTFLSIPFTGRVIGSMIYQPLNRVVGVRKGYLLSMVALGALSAVSGLQQSLVLLLAERFLVGVAFGVTTSIAVAAAASTGNRKVMGLVMAGWAFGWLGAAVAYSLVHFWSLLAFAGLIAIPLAPLTVESPQSETRYSIPPLFSILVAFAAFEPAFALQLAPTLLEQEGADVLPWMMASYGSAVPMYFALPWLYSKSRLGLTSLVALQGVSGVAFFVTRNPAFLVLFTFGGLGLSSLAPILASELGAKPEGIGIALNLAALGGLGVPVASSLLGTRQTASLITLVSFVAFSLIINAKGRKSRIDIYR